MKVQSNIKINSLFITIVVLVSMILLVTGTLIGKKIIEDIFKRTVKNYFVNSASFSQIIFDKKIETIRLSTHIINIPPDLIESNNQEKWDEFLYPKLGENLDFLIYFPKDTSETIKETGIYLYDIDTLKNKITKNKISFLDKELVLNKEQNNIQAFILSSKKIIDTNSGRVLGTLIGGVDLGFQSQFISDIKRQTNLDEVYILVDSKPINLAHAEHNETNIEDINIFLNTSVTATKYSNLLINNKVSRLQLAMTKKNLMILDITKELKKDFYKIPLVFISIFIVLFFIIKIFLVSPIIKLKEYAQALANRNKTILEPEVYISEYSNLANYLKILFIDLHKSKDIQEEQFLALRKAKAKIDESMNLIDKFVLLSTTDIDGNITYVSNAFSELSGYTKQELLGKNHRIMKNHITTKSVIKDMWNTLLSGKIWRGEISNLKKDGTPYWTNNTVAPVYENGEIVAFTAVRQDSTNQKKIEELVIIDTLTGLHNRRFIEDSLREIKIYHERYKEAFFIAIFDIDDFKIVNDTCGHQVGDEVIKGITKIIKENSRVTDIVGRWGGEEFMVIMKKCNMDNAKKTLEKIRAKIEANIFENIGSKTVSIGLASFDGNIEKSIKLADDALYNAKNNGKNKIEVALEQLPSNRH